MAVDPLIEDAHRTATDLEPKRLAGELQELLGQKLLAFAVGDRHPKTIGRYARGERPPEAQALGRLVDIYTVVRILDDGMRRASVKAWMMGSNPRLKGRAPIEAIHDGRAYEVMGAARAFVAQR
jgi:Rv2175c C-terminal domain of unknown function